MLPTQSIATQCPGCGIERELPPDSVGKSSVCPKCDSQFAAAKVDLREAGELLLDIPEIVVEEPPVRGRRKRLLFQVALCLITMTGLVQLGMVVVMFCFEYPVETITVLGLAVVTGCALSRMSRRKRTT